MRKYIVILFILFFAVQGFCQQTLNCKVNGAILIDVPYKYAYLYLSDTKSVINTSIVDKKFQFNVAREKSFETGVLFLSKDSLTATNALGLVKKGIVNSRLIAIEDLHVEIKTDVKEAIVKGGSYNNDITEMLDEKSRASSREFFEKHPDSPVSLIYLKLQYLISRKSHILRSIIPCREHFNMLSDNLKNSEEGKKLWKEIDTL